MSEELIMMGWLFSRVTSLTMLRWTLPSRNRLMDINCIKYETCLPELINGVLIIIKCLVKNPAKQTTNPLPPNPQNKTRGGGDAAYQNKAGLG